MSFPSLPPATATTVPPPPSLPALRSELAQLEAHKRALALIQRQNVAQQHATSRSLVLLRRNYHRLVDCLRWLDQADLYDLEDQTVEVVHFHHQTERDAVKCPFTAEMIRNTPLTRLQAVERAELDILLAGSPWAATEDSQLETAVIAAARKEMALQLLRDTHRQCDPTQEAAEMDDAELLRFVDGRQHLGCNDQRDSATFDRLDWTLVASRVPLRNPEECRTRWIQVVRPGVSTSAWSADEQKQLHALVASHLSQSPTDAVPWERIASQLSTKRTGYSAFLAYTRAAPPSTPFSRPDDAKLRALFELFGGAWKLITLHHPSARSSHQLYGRFVRSIDPGITKGKWTAEEDDILIKMVQQYGESDWSTVASRLRGRTNNQCRDRYANRIKDRFGDATSLAANESGDDEDGNKRKGKNAWKQWTKEEETVLVSLLTPSLELPQGETWNTFAERLSDALMERGGRKIRAKQARDRADLVRKKRKANEDGIEQPRKRKR